MPTKKRSRSDRGQALVETALILGLLLFIIFVMIESARLFQANLTVQNAAREAGRYAITGDYDPGCLPGCDDPRVASIKQVAQENLTGLQIDAAAAYEDPKYYLIEVFSVDENGNFIQDSAGGPGDPVMVRVTYRVGILTPFVNAIARTVRVTGQVIFNNEQFDQYSGSSGKDEAPEIPAPPTAGPSPTPQPPDLTLTKSDYPDPAIVNETLEYTFFMQNLGDVEATGVVVTDTLPGDPGDLVVTDPGPCSVSGVTLVCPMTNLTAGSSNSFSIRVKPQAPLIGSTITNTAVIGGNETDPVPSSNNASEATEIVDTPTTADLEVRKTSASGTLVAVGDLLSYNVIVINHGLAEATNVTVVDTLPGSVVYVDFSSTDAGDTCTPAGADAAGRGGTLTCELGDLPRDASVTLTIDVRPEVEEDVTNSVTVSSDTPEPADAEYPNTADVTVTVENATDLSVTKTLSPNPGRNEIITYTVSIVNNGPAQATGVTITDALPIDTNVRFVGFGGSDGDRCGESGKVVTCDIGTLLDGASDSVQILVRADLEGVIVNDTGVFGDQRDPYNLNDNYSLSREIRARADLTITRMLDSPDPAESGSYLDYQVVVRNDGPSVATGVSVEDTLPAETTFVSASSPQGTCGSEGGVVTCEVGDLEVNETATVNIRVIPTLATDGNIVNQATVRATETDPDLTNNTDAETTAVNAYTFMTLEPICGDQGITVTVKGYNWGANNNESHTITWDPGEPDEETLYYLDKIPGGFASTGLSWTQVVTVPTDAGWREEHIIEGDTKDGKVVETATFQVPCPAPDLEVLGPPTVITPTVPATDTYEIKAGEPVTFSVAITNSGDLDAINQFFVGLYLSDSPLTATTHISQSYRVGLQAISGLAVGRGRTLTFTVPLAFGTPGTHYVYAVVDSDPAPLGLITEELDETNNVSAVLEVVIADSDNPTPTPETTATATATPANPGGINGIVNAPAPGDNTFPQQNVKVVVFDTARTTVISTTYTNNSGEYFFTNLAPETFAMSVCIDIDGTPYGDTADGVIVNSGAFTRQDFLLEEDLTVPCGS